MLSPRSPKRDRKSRKKSVKKKIQEKHGQEDTFLKTGLPLLPPRPKLLPRGYFRDRHADRPRSDGADLPPYLSKLQTLSSSSDDATTFRAKDPLHPIVEALQLCSEGLQALLQDLEKLQRLEKILAFLTSSSYYSPPPGITPHILLVPRLPSIPSLQSDNHKGLEAVGAHSRTIESCGASVVSQETPMSEYEAQLSQSIDIQPKLRRRSLKLNAVSLA